MHKDITLVSLCVTPAMCLASYYFGWWTRQPQGTRRRIVFPLLDSPRGGRGVFDIDITLCSFTFVGTVAVPNIVSFGFAQQILHNASHFQLGGSRERACLTLLARSPRGGVLNCFRFGGHHHGTQHRIAWICVTASAHRILYPGFFLSFFLPFLHCCLIFRILIPFF